MTWRGLDPRIGNISIDANALDRDGSARDDLIERFLALWNAGEISVVVPKGVRAEVQRPQTPAHVKSAILPHIYTLPTTPNLEELERMRRLRALIQGNARSGKHDADVDHLFEAAKYGGAYFVTHDGRILNKRHEIQSLLGRALRIVTLAEFFEVYDRFQQEESPCASSSR